MHTTEHDNRRSSHTKPGHTNISNLNRAPSNSPTRVHLQPVFKDVDLPGQYHSRPGCRGSGLSKVEFSRIPRDAVSPAPDNDLSLYHLVVSQAVHSEEALCELEELCAENERKDIELDQALQDCESSVSSLESQFKGL
ncbi:hypothetical protein BGW80DRAFT_1458370 [Lactifluus volemus]|nr:hypothetical protein BGW80DRAFT_1458370 [Lactifluus volemus]